MRQILTVKDQTIFDIAAQEYGNAELAFQILDDNDLSGKNDFPIGYVLGEGVDFDITYPIIAGTTINIQDYVLSKNLAVKKDMTTVIS